MKYLPSPSLPRRALGLAALLAAAWAAPALPAETAIADAPLFTSSADIIQPNILFILDNSGSMNFEYLPEAAQVLDENRRTMYGFHTSQCNGLAYNPATVYALPVDHAGNTRPMPSTDFDNPATETTGHRTLSGTVQLKSVGTTVTVRLSSGQTRTSYEKGETVTVFQDRSNYYVATVTGWDSGDRDLSLKVVELVGTHNKTLSSPRVGRGEPSPWYFKYTGSLTRLGYTYSSGKVVTTSNFYKECTATIGTRGAPFQRVDVTSASSEAANFAIWRAYYRTRMSLMQAGVSRAFKDINDRYRVGYMTLNDWSDSDNFLDVKGFSFSAASGTGHKKDFYDKLWGASPNGGTPLRQALGRAGQYYAKKLSGQSYDPIQYSCQRNFAILSTDGYWNDSSAPKGLGGEAIDDRDGSLARPLKDDSKAKNTLADVAAYYYESDLRDSKWNNCRNDAENRDVCENNVPGEPDDAYHSGGDNNARQHMTTFTLGLGVNGLLRYQPDYLSSSTGDFADLVRGTRSWPTPVADRAETTDDLWHAAVNGRGRYFSADDPNTLTRSLDDALNSIRAVSGSASAASTSSLQPVAGDNDIFVAQFTTQEWTGDVKSYKIDPESGAIGATPTWSAREQLEKKDLSKRVIKYKARDANTLRDFTYANLKLDGYHGLFDNFCAKIVVDGLVPKQCAELNETQLGIANNGTNLVKYLAGDKSFGPVYRERKALLGDIINASPLFIGKPSFKYEDAGYAGFVSAQATRKPVILAAANDGMLHAFDKANGNELWAYVPTFVLEKMFRLADSGYANRHHFLVDGSPQMADIRVGDSWRTIVVGGLNAGGRGYYALDVTNPAEPSVLWEFQHQDLGLTFGNPIITKRKDGTWVVVFASGYNNGSNGGDGNGHLFVLDAATGTQLTRLSTFTGPNTPAGTSTDPSGLARINAWVPSELDNTALRFYAGDMKGNVWRFDTDDRVGAAGSEAMLLATLTDGPTAQAKRQPVTTRPAVGEIDYNGQKYPVVYVATGRYLGLPDLQDDQVQSVYAIRDKLTDVGYSGAAGVRGTDFVEQRAKAGRDAKARNTRSQDGAPLPMDWSTKSGWRVDFPVGGERVSVNPQLALETLYVGSNVPSPDACDVGGESFLYEFNFATGAFQSTLVGDVLVQGLTLVQLTTPGASEGSIVSIITRSDGGLQTIVGAPSTAGTGLRRTSWRELVD